MRRRYRDPKIILTTSIALSLLILLIGLLGMLLS